MSNRNGCGILTGSFIPGPEGFTRRHKVLRFKFNGINRNFFVPLCLRVRKQDDSI